MNVRAIFKLVTVACALVVGLLLGGCDEGVMSNAVIVHNDVFVVGTDSVTQGTIAAWVDAHGRLQSTATPATLDSLYGSDSALRWVADAAPALPIDNALPQYHSQQALVDAVYDLSRATMARAMEQRTPIDATMRADNAHTAMVLTLAMLAPDACKAALRGQVRDGMVRDVDEDVPHVNRHLAWVMAAWETYCADGDSTWLAWAHDVARRTIDCDEALLMNPTTGLMQGVNHRLKDYYPAWLTPLDEMAGMSLGVNVALCAVHGVMSEMCDVLGIDSDHEQRAAHLRDVINQQLWDEDRSRYAMMLTGAPASEKLSVTDNMAQAIAVMWDIATDERAEKLVESTPVWHEGVGVTHPWSMSTEPYFDQPTWPVTQALWTIAAAEVGNENMVRRGWGAMLRAQALFQSRHLHEASHPVDEVALSAASMAIPLRVIAGVRLCADGIEFHPYVPACMPGVKHITDLRYRRATLDITIVGTGSDLKALTLDGRAVEGRFIPADLQGEHQLVMTMQEGREASQHVTIARDGAQTLPRPTATMTDSLWTTMALMPDSAGRRIAAVTTTVAGAHLVQLVADSVATAPAWQALRITANDHDCGCVWLWRGGPSSSVVSAQLLRGDNRIAIAPAWPATAAPQAAMTLRYRAVTP